MKKLTSILLVIGLVFLMSGCKKEDTELEDISFKVLAPLGSPSLAQTHMQKMLPSLGDHVTYEVEVKSGTDPLAAAFVSESHEIIYAPTNMGAKLISTGVPYKFAGTVVWGNLYIATGTDEAFDLDSLDGKEIVVFGQNATPDIIINAILSNHTFTTAPTITYVADAGTAMGTLKQDPTKIVLLAEPVLSVAGMSISNMKTIDLQSEWENMTGDASYPQAGIFVHKDLDKDVVNAYLAEVEKSIAEALSNPGDVATMASELEYGFPVPVLTSAISRSNLDFKNAADSKAALETYFGYIMDVNPVLIGGSLPEDDFYFE